MQLNVERGAPATGKTTRLRATAHKAGQDEHQIISATSYTPSDLELLVRNRAGRGFKVVCVDECREEHIRHLARIKGSLPADLTIHAVVAP